MIDHTPPTADGHRGPPDGQVGRYHRVQAAALVVVAAGAVVAFLSVARFAVIVTLVALLITIMLAPVVGLLRRIGVPQTVGALISTLVLTGAVYGVVHLSVGRLIAFGHQIPAFESTIRHTLESVRRGAERVIPPERQPSATVKETRSWTEFIARRFGSLAEALFYLGIIPFLVYFMLSWQDHARAATLLFFSPEHQQAANAALAEVASLFRGFLLGNVFIGLILSAASAVVFGVLGLPFFYFIALISGFVSLVPYLGVVLALVPPVVAGIGRLHLAGFVVVVVAVFGLHLFALNVLYPKMLGRRVRVNPLAITLALLFFGWLWGAMGLILAVPITGALRIVCEQVQSLQPFAAWLGEGAES